MQSYSGPTPQIGADNCGAQGGILPGFTRHLDKCEHGNWPAIRDYPANQIKSAAISVAGNKVNNK